MVLGPAACDRAHAVGPSPATVGSGLRSRLPAATASDPGGTLHTPSCTGEGVMSAGLTVTAIPRFRRRPHVPACRQLTVVRPGRTRIPRGLQGPRARERITMTAADASPRHAADPADRRPPEPWDPPTATGGPGRPHPFDRALATRLAPFVAWLATQSTLSLGEH